MDNKTKVKLDMHPIEPLSWVSITDEIGEAETTLAIMVHWFCLGLMDKAENEHDIAEYVANHPDQWEA